MKPDYLDAIDRAGPHPFVHQSVILTATQRLLIAEYLTDSFWEESESVNQGDEIRSEILTDAQAAKESLLRGFPSWNRVLAIRADIGMSGLEFSGKGMLRVSGPTLRIGSISYKGCGFLGGDEFPGSQAFACDIVTAVSSTSSPLFINKAQVAVLSANTPISGKCLVRRSDYSGPTSGYDFDTLTALSESDFQIFSAIDPSSFTTMLRSNIATIYTFTHRGTATIQLSNMRWLNSVGETIYQ